MTVYAPCKGEKLEQLRNNILGKEYRENENAEVDD